MVSIKDFEDDVERSGKLTLEQAIEILGSDDRLDSMAEVVALLSPEDRDVVLAGADMEKLQYDWNFWGRPKQIIPDPAVEYSNIHLAVAGRGFGKALDVNELILTTTGFVRMGNLAVGDVVFDEQGNPTKVLHAFEPYETDDVYEVTFSDGTSLIADGSHEWVTWTHSETKNYKRRTGDSLLPDNWAERATRTTFDILETLRYGKRGDLNHRIPLTKSLNIEDRDDLMLDPRLLGLWLGDGSSKAGELIGGVDDMQHYAREFGNTNTPRNLVLTFPGLMSSIRAEGLYKNKHIPIKYLMASESQRARLLSGLMDSDGFVHAKNGYAEFCNTNEELARGVLFLARSLAQNAKMTKEVATLNGIEVGPKYRVTWRPTRSDLFGLPRKASRVKPAGNQISRVHQRMITDVRKLSESRVVRCIKVDSPNSMYLAGEALVPTHNSRMLSEHARRMAMSRPGVRMIALGRTAQDTRDVMVSGESGVMSIPQPEDEKPVYKVNDSAVYWPNGSVMLLRSAEKPDGVRGIQAEVSLVDELASHSPFVGADGLTAFENLRLATRLGEHPHMLIATTPKRVESVRKLLAEAEEKGPRFVRVIRGSTMENKALSDVYMDVILGTNEGNQKLYEQEILGLMLDDDTEGVLWNHIPHYPMEDEGKRRIPFIVVGVDPSVAENPKDECGIVVVGTLPGTPMHRRKAYVLEDASVHGSPEVWARRVVEVAKKWGAKGIVTERNQGDHLVTMALKSIDPTIKVYPVWSGLNKLQRAEPVAQRYSQNKVIHTETFPELESQMTTWQPGVTKKSPDRIDALVHAVTALLIKPPDGLLHAPGQFVGPKGNLPLGGLGTGNARSWGNFGR